MSQSTRSTIPGALRRRLVRAGATAATLAVAAGLTLAAPLSASADEHNDSYAKGQFLSGSVLGTDLADLVSVDPAVAHNDGTQGTQTRSDPFSVTALDALTVGSGGPLQLGLGSFLQLGAVHQFATAKSDGTSMAASGAVTDDGAIQTDANQAAPADATFDLSKLLGAQFASTLADLKLELGAVAAQAGGDLGTASGSYELAKARLTFSSPAVARLTQKVDAALDSVDADVSGLVGRNGALVGRLGSLLPLSGTGLDLLGSDVTLNASIDTGDLKAAVQSLLDSTFSTSSVLVDLETGTVSIDLAKVVGADLDHLAPGTELIDDTVIDRVLDSITSRVSRIADQVIAKVTALLNDAKVTITAHAALAVPQAPILGDLVCGLAGGATGSGNSSTSGGSGSGGVGDLLGGILGGVSQVLGNTGSGGTAGSAAGGTSSGTGHQVCTRSTTPVPDKLTTLDVDIDGSVKQLVSGGAGTARISLKVLNLLKTNIDVASVLKGIGSTLAGRLFGTDGAIAGLTAALQHGLVHPAVAGLVGPGAGPVSEALTRLLSVKVNLQETTTGSVGGMAAASGRMFTETAVRVTVLGGAGGSSLATVDLAQATVGPNVRSVAPGCTTNCGSNTGCTVTCSGTSNPTSIIPTASAVDHLATTGLSIAALVAAMLALLAAGAYLVREGYKRRQLTPVG